LDAPGGGQAESQLPSFRETDMHYNASSNDHGLPYNPFKAIVAPRPIGWITTMDGAGRLNCAPYSFFNAVSDRPPMVAFSSQGMKDSASIAEESGEFTCSFASFDLRDQLYLTSAALPRGTDELALAGLAPAPSRFVRPPRVAAAPAALERKYLSTTPLTARDGSTSYFLVVGEVVGVYIDDRFIEGGLVDTGAMRPLMRAGYDLYASLGREQMFRLDKPEGEVRVTELLR
jgi:flavin reductase (DIM6/NTAB) family NADH-FMN oxidoreductase RutF